jgi:hypothetical protein
LVQRAVWICTAPYMFFIMSLSQSLSSLTFIVCHDHHRHHHHQSGLDAISVFYRVSVLHDASYSIHSPFMSSSLSVVISLTIGHSRLVSLSSIVVDRYTLFVALSFCSLTSMRDACPLQCSHNQSVVNSGHFRSIPVVDDESSLFWCRPSSDPSLGHRVIS